MNEQTNKQMVDNTRGTITEEALWPQHTCTHNCKAHNAHTHVCSYTCVYMCATREVIWVQSTGETET